MYILQNVKQVKKEEESQYFWWISFKGKGIIIEIRFFSYYGFRETN